MYKKEFIALTVDQLKRVNASALAKTFECSSSYVSRILKSDTEPKNERAKKILAAAKEIIQQYESINPAQ
ncbi:hypothetical protein Peternella1_2 [Winogradskyella phage Peternella_1]|uniref:Uncharacterized protein n=1 Tax=Winogradskyella phage Peternella_1 TaxID=2745699 RepID=A0A8E5EA52_9CAUD|nr:hypothetical protein M1M32_gp02 [Winogradskyella phage Peternella_1]QQV91538.1 hypothetical protein Peternella1_2 [Winogradskyella phage Peternella_1]